MKAVILAGGNGTRLYPLTKVTSKQLLPIGNKPLIYYPVSLAMLAGIKDFLIITQESNIKLFQQILGDGRDFGIKVSYQVQDEPLGLAHGLNFAKDFVGNDNFVFMLGDNILHGHGLTEKLASALKNKENAMFSWYVDNPRAFGVINGDEYIDLIEEKPENPKSNWASLGLYVFNSEIFNYYPNMKPSARGEMELPSLVMEMINKGVKVKNIKLGRGYAWFDAGTLTDYQRANSYIIAHEDATKKYIGCLEEIAFNNGWINDNQLEEIIGNNKSEYFEYLRKVKHAKERK